MPAPDSAVETLKSLLALASDLASEVDVSVLLERMLASLMQVFRAERGFVLLQDTKTRTLKMALARGDAVDATGVSTTVARRVAESRAPLLITDAEALSDLKAAARSLAHSDVRSIICAPLIHDDHLLGVLYLDSHLRQRPYGRDDLTLLDTTARGAAGLIANALEKDQLRRDVRILRALQRDTGSEFDRVIGKSPALTAVLKQARAVSQQDVTTLILGPSGTGKELLAKAIHGASRRRDQPFVAVNCAALAPDVIESELFGHEKGAFTGAADRRVGRFELADRGTLFLDEIGELKPDVQVKLLRVLQERQIERVGSAKTIDIDVRLLAATNADLTAAVKAGTFREDLYYRLNVIGLRLPPLAERQDDIPLLVSHFIETFNKTTGRHLTGIEPAALEALTRYRWPGNIRELRNVIERAFVLEPTDRLTPDSLPADLLRIQPAPQTQANPFTGYPPQLAAARDHFERAFILDALKRHAFNVTATAQALDVPRNTLYRRMESLGIRPAEAARDDLA